MNKIKYKNEAFLRMPKVESLVARGLYRHDIAQHLSGSSNIGIELGVAAGSLSRRLLDTGKFKLLFGVDVYSDIHDTNEYKAALATIGLDSHHKILRLTFSDALSLFPDNYFDFVYIDGFAHTGEEGGQTLSDWYRKLKVGGIMSGDDYHPDWPLVMWAVNHFSSQLGQPIRLTEHVESDPYSRYPSWFVTKQADLPAPSLDPRLVEISALEKRRIHRMRTSVARRTFKRLQNQLGRLLKVGR